MSFKTAKLEKVDFPQAQTQQSYATFVSSLSYDNVRDSQRYICLSMAIQFIAINCCPSTRPGT